MVAANGVEFECLTWADTPGDNADAPLALLLHGFPDTAHTWRHLGPALAQAGYRAVAPSMRGYAPTEVPRDGRYQTGALVADAHALWEALGGTKDAVVIGHDWGAVAAYGAATLGGTERWAKVVTLAVPPPPALAGLFMQYDQLRRSWYMFFFQHPLAEALVGMNDMDFIARLWQDWSPGYPYEEDVAHVRRALGSPEHLAAALGYYRAMLGGTADAALAAEQDAAGQVPPQPLLYLHGTTDGCMGIDLATGGWPATVPVEGAGHFLQLEKPAEVNRLIVEFLAS